MNKNLPVRFTVEISSVENATWQGCVSSGDEMYEFISEIQLFKWLVQRYPELLPKGKEAQDG